MLHPDFCTTVFPNEYDCIGGFEQAVKEANKFHNRIHEDLPPPYYTFDYGKLYGLVKYYADIKAAEQSMHLTDGTLRDFLASATPEQLSALKDLLNHPIGK
jgi:hypothetical protein